MAKRTKKIKEQRAGPFHATREHHSAEIAEDYTELIYELIESRGEARIRDLAEQLGVSHVTALRAVRRLQKEGYLTKVPRKPILLTAKGRRLALFARSRHALLVEFLQTLGVTKKQAEIDAEGAEHHLSRETLRCIRRSLGKKSKA
ncbi:MAG: winged helix-turn-helix transcriptional regulator [Candidatus Dadabacteria bacterium]|nr:MAG: winged helix-turn-helix transcriptional regulator [Candidatus Dadabacteria bacterium]